MKSIVITIVLIAAGALFAYTNPTLDSYKDYLHQTILKETNEKHDPLGQALGSLFGGVASSVIASQTVRHDYVFLSTYETKFSERERLRAVGLLKNFFVVENPVAAGK